MDWRWVCYSSSVSTPGMMGARERRPWEGAFWEERALPLGVWQRAWRGIAAV